MQRLATYGTLGPGRANHHVVAGIPGSWRRGVVRGRLVDEGWGAELGFPGLILIDEGDPLAVDLLESDDLAGHWARLDEFEGPGYRRVTTTVETVDGAVDACIYVIRSDA